MNEFKTATAIRIRPAGQECPALADSDRQECLSYHVSRREFLSGAGRFCAAAGLAGGCAYLALRQSNADARDCVKVVPCDDCGSFVRCQLPKAQLSRKSKNLEQDGVDHA